MSIRSLALGLALALAACQSPRPAPSAAQKDNPQTPVARVNGQPISLAQLDDQVKKDLKQLEQQYQEQVYEVKRRALEQMIQKQVFEVKAKAVGVASVEELLQREIGTKLPEPSEGELRALYEQAKANGQQLPPFDQIKANIANYLKNQKGQELLAKYYEDLKKEMKVEVLLPPYMPPKVEVAATGPAKGPENAPVTIVEFSDYQCPYCVRAEPTVREVVAAYGNKVRLVYRDFPLPSHTLAPKASEAAHCAGDQGKFWEMHDRLFAANGKLDEESLKGYAKEVGLDTAKFNACLASGEKAAIVAFHKKGGDDAGVSGTPAFYINGHLLSGARSVDDFKQIIDGELAAGATAQK